MYYRFKQDHVPDKEGNLLWRPEIVRTGKTVNVQKLSELISTATTLTQADIAAVLYSLPQAMNVYLREGHSVRLDGVGIFTVYGRTRGTGVIDKKDVRPSQFTSLQLKFTPEYHVAVGGARTRSLLNDIEFINVDRLSKGLTAGGDSDNAGDNNDDDDYVDPNA